MRGDETVRPVLLDSVDANPNPNPNSNHNPIPIPNPNPHPDWRPALLDSVDAIDDQLRESSVVPLGEVLTLNRTLNPKLP